MIPESGISWVKIGDGQGIQGTLFIHKKGISYLQPLSLHLFLFVTPSPEIEPLHSRDSMHIFVGRWWQLEYMQRQSGPHPKGFPDARSPWPRELKGSASVGHLVSCP